MGMDVVGIKPKNTTGEYFRNNIWWWRPLWTYCESVDPSLTARVPNAQYNSGDGLKTADEAEALGNLLLEKINAGETAQAEEDYNQFVANLPLENCELCGGTGIRTDDVAKEHGLDSKKLDPNLSLLLGRDTGWCNGCNGEGKRQNFAASYSFSVENVKEFAMFLINCGGFEIY